MFLSRIPFIRAIALTLIFAAMSVAPVLAADITVSGSCSLAEAIANANDDAATHSDCAAGSGADTITLSADITLTAALPTITSDITINGGGYTISGDDKYRIITQTSGTAALNNLNLINGKASNSGGAVDQTGGTLTLDGVTVSDNSGGAIDTSSVLTIKNSAILNNTGFFGGGVDISPAGDGPIVIQNSTIAFNRAGFGGGVHVSGSPDSQRVIFRHVTIFSNTSTGEGNPAGGIYSQGATLHIYNSIVAGNSPRDCSGIVHVNAGNLIRTGGCGGSPLTSDPLLPENPTRPSDGSPPYLAIPHNSPARNNAATVACNAVGNVDQRGVTRPQGDGCDIGAYEYDGSSPPPQQNNPPPQNNNPPPENNNPPPDNNNPPPDNNNPPPDNNNPPPDNNNPPPGDSDPGDSDDDDDDDENEDEAENENQRPSSDSERHAAPRPQFSTCRTLPVSIIVTGIHESTQCQRVGAEGIGNQVIIDAGFVDAVDVWSYVLPNMQVCFLATGSGFRFLDAATAPRSVSTLPAYSVNGMTCATIGRAGTLVLMAGPPPPGAQATAQPTAQPTTAATPAPAAASKRDCRVTTTEILNFRAAPNGAKIGELPKSVTLSVLARQTGWYKVDWYGAAGWISADYATPYGDCG